MTKIDPFRYYETSPEIIKLAVMYYVRYPLSLRQVEDILHERGIDICHETVRYWWNRFGQILSREMKKKSNHRASNWRWHIDEVFVKINGENYYLWRAIDHEGTILECYASKKRDKKAAQKILKKLLKRYGKPQEIVTDRCPSYRAELKDLNLEYVQITGRSLNNKIENSHMHFRRRERGMNKFRLLQTLQKFTAIHSIFLNHFNHQRHIESRKSFKNLRQRSVDAWQEIYA